MTCAPKLDFKGHLCFIIAATMIKCTVSILQQYLTVLANWILTGSRGRTLLLGGRL